MRTWAAHAEAMTHMALLGLDEAARSMADERAFRELMSVFPSGVTVITTRDRQGRPRGLTCTSICSVSLHPPLLLACLRNGSESLEALLDTGTFAVNLLHANGKAAAETFASATDDRFAQVPWRRTPHRGLPWLHADAHAVAECRVVSSLRAGDHVVVFGEVGDVIAEPGRPLLYGLRTYATWCPEESPDGQVIPLRR